MILEDWRTKCLADLADYKAGRTPARARSEYWKEVDDAVPWVAISDMTEYGTVTATKERISKTAFERVFRNTIVPTGTLIMSFKLTIGRVATLGVDACHNEAIISIYPREGVDQRFLGYFLSQVDYAALQDRQVKGNTLNREKIDRIKVWCPPLDEQIEIADVLDLLRRAIWLEAEALNTAQDLKHAAMQALFTNGLRGEAQKETEIGPVSESWTVAPLDAHFSAVSGGTPSRSNPSYWQSGTIPWIKTTEVNYCVIEATEEKITLEGLNNSAAKLLLPGTLLLAMYGQGVTRGKVATLGIEAACNQACAAIRSTDQVVDPMYLYHFLTYRYHDIRRLAHGGQQQNLNLDIVRRLPIAFPTNDIEQREIVTILDTIDRKIDLHRQKRAVLDDLFKNILHKLMTGEIRTADLDLLALSNSKQPSHKKRTNRNEA